MKNILFLYHYKNYYDRKAKHFATLAEYLNVPGLIKQNVNFTPADGVNSTLVTNWTEDWNPDYMVIFDDMDNIVSRWYILESVRTLNGQYKLSVRRDVIADYFNDIIDSPIYVLKGKLEAENPLIYNSERLQFNQIKKSETLLQDETGTPWIVAYTAKGTHDTKTVSVSLPTEGTPEIEELGVVLKDPNDYTKGAVFSYPSALNISLYHRKASAKCAFTVTYDYYQNYFTGVSQGSNIIDGKLDDVATVSFGLPHPIVSFPEGENMKRLWLQELKNKQSQFMLALDTHLKGVYSDLHTIEEYNTVMGMSGKIVWSDVTQKYYRFLVEPFISEEVVNYINPQTYNTSLLAVLDSARDQLVAKMPDVYLIEARNGPNRYSVRCKMNHHQIRLVETAGPSTISATINATHAQLTDAPYNMICAPFMPETLALAQAMVEEYTTAIVYDVQILPFCPMRKLMTDTGIDRTGTTETFDYIPIKKGGETTIAYAYWATTSSDHFIIKQGISIPDNAIDIKVANECDFYRLNSPNYAGAYDFSAVKNGGVDYFHAYFTYKPYSPYIQISPNFKGLYGQDFGDARGLICGGDFSIAMTSDAWKNYEVQNKNYQNIFNTQIQTMDKNHKLEMISQGVSGTLQGAGLGAGAAALLGPAGLLAAIPSLGGMAADLAIGESMYQNSKQSQIDIFNYNLGNIQARPDSLTKVSAYTIVNKYFPFIEYYSATDVEKEMMRNKITYEGMTVMTIGTIRDFIKSGEEFNFFKGQLIQVGNISDDYHLADTIGVELEKGVYL